MARLEKLSNTPNSQYPDARKRAITVGDMPRLVGNWIEYPSTSLVLLISTSSDVRGSMASIPPRSLCQTMRASAQTIASLRNALSLGLGAPTSLARISYALVMSAAARFNASRCPASEKSICIAVRFATTGLPPASAARARPPEGVLGDLYARRLRSEWRPSRLSYEPKPPHSSRTDRRQAL